MNIPFVPYRAFCSLIGAEQAAAADKLLVQSGLSGLVLMSDDSGTRLVMIPVGAGHPCADFSQVESLETEGQSVLCALKVSDVREAAVRQRREAVLSEREAAVNLRERRVAEAEKRIAEIARTLAEREVFSSRKDSSGPTP